MNKTGAAISANPATADATPTPTLAPRLKPSTFLAFWCSSFGEVEDVDEMEDAVGAAEALEYETPAYSCSGDVLKLRNLPLKNSWTGHAPKLHSHSIRRCLDDALRVV